ncbi:M23 family metallopeptidase [Demequina lutea]|uniref:Murein DD-endopeptidase MepM/ murein hydrolase activator NlpD n=1 Tax=Demequina lutea TaxID=431489 RepID=A0A7Y9ZAL2_9MICO|nr:M23 family metallopeptidase [Demequina lutea]NYI41847.1 murein DD-endopeptidase MepM/ murein hydrolase activator NlpD [Demequina lutea]
MRQARPTHRHAFLGALAVLAALSIGVLACAHPADAATRRVALSAPVAPFTVQRLASLPPQPWLAGHRGVDLAADTGERVTAPATGVVTYVGFVVDRPVVSIRHVQGLVSSFEPVDSTAVVGDIIARGQTIGTVADTPLHCVRRQCVHWGLRLNGTYVDPLDYLEGFGPVRLLPTDGD